MANVLLELGGVRRLSFLGARGPDFQTDANFQELADLVTFWENPLVGMRIPADEIPEDQLAVLARLRALSNQERNNLAAAASRLAGRPSGIRFTGMDGLRAELAGGFFSGLTDKLKGFSKMFGKDTIAKLLGGAASLIPGMDGLAGTAIGKLLGMTAPAKDGSKPAESGGGGVFGFLGDVFQVVKTVGTASGKQSSANAVVSSTAAATGSSGPAAAAVPAGQYASPDLIATILKGFGQVAGLNNMAVGSGVQGGLWGGDVTALINAMQGNPTMKPGVSAGLNDILNSAAFAGDQAAVQEAIRRGTPSDIPWTYIGIGGGVLLISTAFIAVLSRR